jgi:hypothetical protein
MGSLNQGQGRADAVSLGGNEAQMSGGQFQLWTLAFGIQLATSKFGLFKIIVHKKYGNSIYNTI